jgi:hypothetical protein
MVKNHNIRQCHKSESKMFAPHHIPSAHETQSSELNMDNLLCNILNLVDRQSEEDELTHIVPTPIDPSRIIYVDKVPLEAPSFTRDNSIYDFLKLLLEEPII